MVVVYGVETLCKTFFLSYSGRSSPENEKIKGQKKKKKLKSSQEYLLESEKFPLLYKDVRYEQAKMQEI